MNPIHNGVIVMPKPMYSCARVRLLKSTDTIVAMAKHGKRVDKSCEQRVNRAKSADNIAWSCAENGDPLDVFNAFKTRKKNTNAKEYGKAAVGVHVLLIVSPEWVEQKGDLHDPKNPRNIALNKEAKVWAEKIFGENSVIATRMDMDEMGGAVVDVFAVPVVETKHRKTTKNVISVRKRLTQVFGDGRCYRQIQDSWSDHCKATLSPELQRGISVEITGRKHVHSAIIGPALGEQKRIKKEIEEETVSKRAELKAEEEAKRAAMQRDADIFNARKRRLIDAAESKGFAKGLKKFEATSWPVKVGLLKASLNEKAAQEIRQKAKEAANEIVERERQKLADMAVKQAAEEVRRQKAEAEMRAVKAREFEAKEQLQEVENFVTEGLYNGTIPEKFARKLRKILTNAPALDRVLATMFRNPERGKPGQINLEKEP